MVSERSGQPIDERFWLEVDPHVSTWPACVATKAAGLRGKEVGDRYLRRLRRAVLTERTHIDQETELLRLARDVDGLDYETFQTDLRGERAQKAFQDDLALCATFGATGFPTMLFKPAEPTVVDQEHPAILVGGHRSRDTYEAVLAKVAPDLEQHKPREVEVLLAEYGPLTSRELCEIFGMKNMAETERDLREWATQGRIIAVALRGGTMWARPGDGTVGQVGGTPRSAA